MTERKAQSVGECAATQRTADRRIRQVSDLLLNHGELSSWVIHEPAAADWVGAPVQQRIGKWFHFGCYGNGSYYVWPHSVKWESTNPVRVFDSLGHSLAGLLSSQLERLPESLTGWLRGDPADPLSRWVWFVSGFATTPLPSRQTRTRRKCWGNDGVSYFDADKLESQRTALPDYWRGVMPPNADCWLVETKDLLQTTIDAVEYLAELSIAPATPLADDATGGTRTTSDKQGGAVAELAAMQAAKNRGGRKPKRERTPLESKVLRFVEANPTYTHAEVDKSLNLANEKEKMNKSSRKIVQRVQRRERRHQKADKTGRN